ncbi:RIP metalloprotease [Chloroflexota bacterium]
MILTILIGLAVLSVLVLVHELGHFITAKACAVKVEEFGLGYPPRLLSKKRGETLYSLNLIPFGGFNRLAGEEDPEGPRSLASKSAGVRLLVISAGAIMNFILPIILLSVAFMVPHYTLTESILVYEVAPDSPAATVGIQVDDTILEINGTLLQNRNELSRYIHLNLGKKITLLIQHPDSTTKEVQFRPRWRPPEGQGATGVSTINANPVISPESLPFWEAIPMGAKECVEALILSKNGLISMVIGAKPVAFTGPVGIVQLTGEVAKAGISPLLEIAALLSIALGLTQLLPVPALDGGRIAFVLLEWVRRGKRISPQKEGLVHLIGFGILIVLLLVITYQDIFRIISGDSLL